MLVFPHFRNVLRAAARFYMGGGGARHFCLCHRFKSRSSQFFFVHPNFSKNVPSQFPCGLLNDIYDLNKTLKRISPQW